MTKEPKDYLRISLTLSGWIVALTGLLALAGWIAGVRQLTQISPLSIPMALDTALGFVLLGIALLACERNSARRRVSAIVLLLTGAVGAYGFLKVTEIPLNHDLTFARSVLRIYDLLRSESTSSMSPVTGALFFLSAIAVIVHSTGKDTRWRSGVTGWIGVVVGCTGFLATYGYLLGAPFLYQSGIIPLAASTAFAFCVLGVGLVLSAGRNAILKPFVGGDTQGRTLRLFVPLVVFTCFAQEFLHDYLLQTTEIPRALLILFVPLGAALIAVATGERLTKYLSKRLYESERMLTESQEKYRSVVEHAHDLIWTVDRQGNFVSANQRCADVSGYKVSDWIGQGFERMLDSKDVPRIRNIFIKALSGEPQEYEVAVNRVDGSKFFLEVTTVPEYKLGQIIGVASFARDITNRKRLQTELEMMKHAVDMHFDGAYWMDSENRFIYVNENACAMLGYSREELLGKTVDMVSPQATPERLRNVWESLRSKSHYSSESLHRRKDGSTFPVEITASYVRFGDQEYNCGFARDITERKDVEKNLREKEERVQLLFDNLTVGVYRTTPDGRVLIANPALVKMFGYSSFAELAGVNLETRHYAPSHPRSEFRMCLETQGEIHGFESAWIRPDGSIVYMRENARVIRDAVGAPLYYEGTAEDITEHKRVQEGLRISEAHLSNAIRLAKLGYWGYDFEADIFTFNDEFYALFGTTAEKMGGYTMPARRYAELFVHPDDIPMVGDAIRQSVETTDPNYTCQLEHRVVFANGEIGHIAVRFRIIKDGAGRTIRSFGMNQDITEGKQAADNLQQSLSLLEATLESTADGILVVDTRGRVTAHNQRFLDMWGVPYSLANQDDDETLLNYVVNQLADPASFLSKVRDLYAHPDAESYDLLDFEDGRCLERFSRPQIINENVVGRVWSFRDISERKLADESLRRLKKAVETSGEVVFMTDVNGIYTYVNPAFTELDEYAPGDVIGKATPNILQSGQTTMETYSLLWSTLLNRRIFRGELINRTKDGRNVAVDVSVSPVVNEQGSIEGFLAVQRDMSERIRAQKEKQTLELQLRQAQKMETIGTLAGGVAHDFNNILTPILVYSEIAAKTLGDGHPQRRDLEHVIAGAHRAKDLVKQILTFSRQTEQERILIELSPIVKEALKLLQASFPSTIEIETNIQAECGEVLADPSQIHQVLMNLCTNALHAMREHGGVLSVNLESVTLSETEAHAIVGLSPGNFVRLCVTDTGCGMDEQTQERIFEPFFTTKKVGEGTGLGLSVVHGIVKSHDGAISVQSAIGKGTVFAIYLPRIDGPDKCATTDTATTVAGGDEHILVVDDEPEIASVLQEVLEEIFGYTVSTCTISTDALDIIRKQPHRFDLVIADLTMPQLTGDQLAREIQAIRADLPIILMTGFSETIDEERCHEMGIAGFLLKPPRTADLAQMVRNVLDGVRI